MPLEESELILRPDSRLYHINLRGDEIADDVIIVGDPGRVEDVSSHFSTIEYKTSHREFITHTGSYNGRRITVISSGIGTDNMEIVETELDAAVNIDPLTRTPKAKLRRLRLFRLGTCGALQSDVPVDSLIVSAHSIGMDTLLNYYNESAQYNDNELSDAFIAHMEWNKRLPYPYCIKADLDLLQHFKLDYLQGITATAPGFYAPQGRELRLKSTISDLNTRLATFQFRDLKILNFEMETSALYGLAAMLGHSSLTACVVIANRSRREFSVNYHKSVGKLIVHTLDKITGI
jgi:uridine phosphorylase